MESWKNFTLIEKLDFLKQYILFQDYTDEELGKLLSILQEFSFQPGDIIVRQGEAIDSVYLLLTGEIEVIQEKAVNDEKKSHTLSILFPGSSIGLTAYGYYSSSGLRTATVRSLKESVLLRLKISDYQQFLGKHEKLNIRTQEAASQKQDLIKSYLAFRHYSENQIIELLSLMQEIAFSPDDIVVKEGDLVDSIYLIEKGQLEVSHDVVQEGKHETQPLVVLRPGESIGLMGYGVYSESGTRTATIKAITQSTLLCLKIEEFNDFLKRHPLLNKEMQLQADNILRMHFIKKAKPFVSLPNEKLKELAALIIEQEVPAGELIFAKGDRGDQCYLLIQGKVKIFDQDKGREKIIANLEPFDLFGEAALFSNGTRNASACAVTDSKVLILRRPQLLKIISEKDEARKAMKSMLIKNSRPFAYKHIIANKRTLEDGDVLHVLKDPIKNNYYQLSTTGFFIWKLLDGKHSIREIATTYNKKFGEYLPDDITNLIVDLSDADYVHIPKIEQQAETNASLFYKIFSRLRTIMEISFPITNANGWLTKLYNNFFYLFFTWPAKVLMLATFVIGIISFIFLSKNIAVTIQNTSHIGLIIILTYIATFISTPLHELGHAMTTKYYGREVNNVGIGWFWIGPVFFVDSSDMWLESRRARIGVNFAGIVVDSILAGIAAIIALQIGQPEIKFFLWLFALYTYFSILKNLDPLLEFDGYYILMDILGVPNLREHAVIMLTNLFPNLKNKQFYREHTSELIYWSVCLLFLMLITLVTFLLGHYVIAQLMPGSHDNSKSYFSWALPLLAVTISSLGIWSEVRQRRLLQELNESDSSN